MIDKELLVALLNDLDLDTLVEEMKDLGVMGHELMELEDKKKIQHPLSQAMKRIMTHDGFRERMFGAAAILDVSPSTVISCYLAAICAVLLLQAKGVKSAKEN